MALVGGGEFLPPAAPLDAWLLARAGTDVVTVIPTAAGRHAGMAIATARRHFAGLGAQVEGPLIVDRSDAEDPAAGEALAAARILYLAGGDPRRIQSVLQGTPAWQGMLAALAAGAVLAGSSAGAMVLCDRMLVPGSDAPTPGLGLLGETIVLPHHNRSPARPTQAARLLGPGVQLLGLDEATGLVIDHDGCRVLGAAGAVLYRTAVSGVTQVWRAHAPAHQETCL